MKTYRLSSAGERIAGVTISAILILFMAFLLYALRSDPLALIIVAIAALLLCAVLIFYMMNLHIAACTPDAENKKLFVRGFPDYTLDLSQAVSLETVSYKNGPVATRILVFSDENGETIATLPTLFTIHEGAQAEPLAMELAEILGLAFKSSLAPWEYDKEKRKEHEKEVAQAEKEARRAEFQVLKAKILRKAKTSKPVPASPEEETPIEGNIIALESDGINYDALDDEK